MGVGLDRIRDSRVPTAGVVIRTAQVSESHVFEMCEDRGDGRGVSEVIDWKERAGTGSQQSRSPLEAVPG